MTLQYRMVLQANAPAVQDRSKSYQLVGGVTAYQGDNG